MLCPCQAKLIPFIGIKLSIPLLCDIISLFEFILLVFPDMLQPSAVFFHIFILRHYQNLSRCNTFCHTAHRHKLFCALYCYPRLQHQQIHHILSSESCLLSEYISTLIRCAICKTSPLFYHYRLCCPDDVNGRPAIFHLCPLWYFLFLHLQKANSTSSAAGYHF